MSIGVGFLVSQSLGSRWPGHQDSNLDQRIQSPLCCRCTMPQNISHDSNTFFVDVQDAGWIRSAGESRHTRNNYGEKFIGYSIRSGVACNVAASVLEMIHCPPRRDAPAGRLYGF